MPYGPARALPGENLRISTDPFTEPFWEAAKARKLVACRCGDCGQFRMPPSPYCPGCQSNQIEWPELSGAGTVFSFAICTRNPADGSEYVYVPVVVDLDDAPGARIITNLQGIDADDVAIGMKVKVAWNPIQDDWVLPIFEPA